MSNFRPLSPASTPLPDISDSETDEFGTSVVDISTSQCTGGNTFLLRSGQFYTNPTLPLRAPVNTSTTRMTSQVTVIQDDSSRPKFTGEDRQINVFDFLKEVDVDIANRNITSDNAKIAFLKTRLDTGQSIVGQSMKTRHFDTFTTYDEFRKEFVNQFCKHTTIGTLVGITRLVETLKESELLPDPSLTVYNAAATASSTMSDLENILKASEWVEANNTMKMDNVLMLFGYLHFIYRLKPTHFEAAKRVPFKPGDSLLELARKISEKTGTHVMQPVRAVQCPPTEPAQSVNKVNSDNRQSRPRNRSGPSPNARGRSQSRARMPSSHRIICWYCRMPGHTEANCFKKRADEARFYNQGPYYRQGNHRGRSRNHSVPYCEYHEQEGHHTNDCRARARQQSSGEASRPQQTSPT